jgi:hypothetical protein
MVKKRMLVAPLFGAIGAIGVIAVAGSPAMAKASHDEPVSQINLSDNGAAQLAPPVGLVPPIRLAKGGGAANHPSLGVVG